MAKIKNKKNVKKDVKRNKPTPKPHTESVKKTPKAKSVKHGESKQAMLIELLKKPGGATIDEIINVTGWQRHSVRGVISGVLKKRLGFAITSEKVERGRIYRIAA